MARTEQPYLDLVRHVLQSGQRRDDRTGVGTLSVFGAQMRFALSDADGRRVVPLLTTKRMFWKGIVAELLWFVSGSTDNKKLQAQGVHFWDANSTQEFLGKRGIGSCLGWPAGMLGPVYGWQWRHFGAPYWGQDIPINDRGAPRRGSDDYDPEDGVVATDGVDQLANVVHLIKTDPTSRRIVMSAWNPLDLDRMALPPCHVLCQFYVDVERKTLSCQVYQRSGDLGLGVPFNIASYALLTHMIAHVCGLQGGELVHTLGDAHVYVNHVEALQEQLAREPRAFPTLELDPAVHDIDGFAPAHMLLFGYEPYPSIKMAMAA
jgi:thymidylate synthase